MLQIRSCSARRYRIQGALPSIYDDAFHRRLTDHRFLPLGAHETATFGWVSADNLLVTDFDVDTVVRGEHAVIALRLDRRRPNARLVRAHVDLALRARAKAAADGGRPARISRDERREIRRGIEEELLEKTSPTVHTTTVLIHPKQKTLYALSRTRSVNEILVRLIQDTFGVELTHLTPFGRGREILAGTEGGLRLDALDRTDFGRLPTSALGARAAAVQPASADAVRPVSTGAVRPEEVSR